MNCGFFLLQKQVQFIFTKVSNWYVTTYILMSSSFQKDAC